jgi:broad specificity phosphatase PhoE
MVQLFLIRHSKSCANLVRHIAGTSELAHPLVAASQQIRDPPLSSVGERMAAAYGGALRRRLAAEGIDVGASTTVIGSSALMRARQTAGLLFAASRKRKGHLEVFPHFTENGAVPENTPVGTRYRRPDWDALVSHLHREHAGAEAFVIVGHGSFLRSAVWPAVAGSGRARPFGNLDGILVSGEFGSDGRLRVSSAKVIPYTGSVNPHTALDTCPLPGPKIGATRRMKHRSQASYSRHRHSRKQKGGGVGMPLAYFKDGAQMQGTSSMPTGVSLAGASAAWARAPLPQTGGRSLTRYNQASYRRTRRHSRSHRYQKGGFPVSLMGQFAANGARVLPVAAYMGYRMLSDKSGGHRATRRRTLKRGTRRA